MSSPLDQDRVPPFLDEVAARFAELARQDLAPRPDESRVVAAARYAVEGGGKRLRPALVVASAMAMEKQREVQSTVAGLPEDLLAVAAAFEYIHTYSLIHDDLPVMDNDALRRGRPACHVAFGVETAIRAGAFLIVRAFALLEGTSLPRRPEIVATLAEVSGIRGMVGGQALDILGENRPPDVASLVRIHTRKTAALIRGAIVAGALAVDADARAIEALGRAGDAMGLAFQVADDVLDVESTAEKMGKPVGVDDAKGKRTYPAVLGLEASKERAAALIAEASTALLAAGCDDTILHGLACFMASREH
jgi:geranylgeranyl pyrophosphate synthase